MRLAFLLSLLLLAPTAALAEPAPPPPLVLAVASPALDALHAASLAQVAAPAAAETGIPAQVLHFILDHLSINTVLTALGIIAGAVGLSAARKRQVALAVYHAFHIVEDVKAECDKDGKTFPYVNKAAAGLEAANEYLVKQGWRPLKPNEQDLAKLTFKSMNAQADAKLALAQAASVVLPQPTVTNVISPSAVGVDGLSPSPR
jgi:membrane-bound lytic murein transglycosylase B